MQGKIIKGKDMSEELKGITTDILGCFNYELRYFVVTTGFGLQIFEIEE